MGFECSLNLLWNIRKIWNDIVKLFRLNAKKQSILHSSCSVACQDVTSAHSFIVIPTPLALMLPDKEVFNYPWFRCLRYFLTHFFFVCQLNSYRSVMLREHLVLKQLVLTLADRKRWHNYIMSIEIIGIHAVNSFWIEEALHPDKYLTKQAYVVSCRTKASLNHKTKIIARS